MVRVRSTIVSSVAVLLGAAFLGSFAGSAHPIGDSLAIFRVPIALTLALLVIWSPWPAKLRWSVSVICLAAMGHIAAQKYVSHPKGPITIYQKNLRFENDQVDLIAADIDAAQPDIVALQELTSRNAALVRMLRGDYPHQASCALVEWARVAILSRWPVEGEICIEGQGLVGVQVMSPDGPFWAFSLHGFLPWPYDQTEQLELILPIIEDLEEPVVIAGDFNMVPWSYTLREFAHRTNTTRTGPLFSTSRRYGARLPIDHVFAPGGGQAEARPVLGSTHTGVLANVFVFEP